MTLTAVDYNHVVMTTQADGVREGPKQLGPLGSLFAMVLMLAAAAAITLSYPFLWPFVAYQRWQARQFVKRMAAALRAMTRSYFNLALEERRGTVIEEWAPFNVGAGPLRRWWTEDDVWEVCPHRLPQDGAGAIREMEFGPFNCWCREVYTGVRGKALLVEYDEGYPLQSEAEFPIAVVTTVFHKG